MKKRKLTPQQLEILTQVFELQRSGMSVMDISKKMGLDRRTIYYWRQRPEWIEMEKELRKRLVDDAHSAVMETLAKNAMAGKSPKWVELYFKVTGTIKEQESEEDSLGKRIREDGVTPDLADEIKAILEEHNSQGDY